MRTLQEFSYYAAGYVQLFYLSLVALTVMVDSVATLTFRWKEYGELTHGQTDATSILFLLCRSRWTLRVVCGLIMSTSLSLRATRWKLNGICLHIQGWSVGGLAGLAICFLNSSYSMAA